MGVTKSYDAEICLSVARANGPYDKVSAGLIPAIKNHEYHAWGKIVGKWRGHDLKDPPINSPRVRAP